MLAIVLSLMLAGAPVQDATRPAPVAVGHMKGTKIQVADLQRSIRFYSEMFGFKVARTIAQGPNGAINEVVMTVDGKFDLGPAPRLVLKENAAGEPVPTADRVNYGQMVFVAVDPAGLKARAEKTGYKVQVFEHGILVVTDPDGFQIEVLPAPKGG